MDEHLDPIGANDGDDPDVPVAADAPARRLGLAELSELAGVSIRTVRYYIAEGLLPPPEGAGPRSAYTTGHLDRLRLIGRLKDAYLPLREIRRRLDGMDDAAVRRLLARIGPPAGPPGARPLAAADPLDSAADYLARVTATRPADTHAAPPAAPRLVNRLDRPPTVAASARGPTVGHRSAETEQDDGTLAASALGRPFPDRPGGAELDPALALLPPDPEAEPAPDDATWRRIRLGPDAELLVREETYRRRRDRVDWLIRWARKVFG